jgi:hypothetical protein
LIFLSQVRARIPRMLFCLELSCIRDIPEGFDMLPIFINGGA